MQTAYRHLGVLLEPAGAAGLAAIAQQREHWTGKRMATILCGGNLTDRQLRDWVLGDSLA
jgi:threonine dehydratase